MGVAVDDHVIIPFRWRRYVVTPGMSILMGEFSSFTSATLYGRGGIAPIGDLLNILPTPKKTGLAESIMSDRRRAPPILRRFDPFERFFPPKALDREDQSAERDRHVGDVENPGA